MFTELAGPCRASQTPKVGRPAWMSRIKTNVPAIAFRATRLVADTNTPAASEKKSAFASTNDIRQNSPSDTPPSSSGIASTGKIASKP